MFADPEADGRPFDVREFPLPEGVTDAEMNKAQIAMALGVSENTVDKWMRKPHFPVLEGGTNGVPYRFRLSAVHAWREWGRAQEQTRRDQVEDAIIQMRMALLNLEDASAADDELRMSPKERQAEYEAEAKYLLAARNRREMMPTAEVMGLLEGVFGLMRDGLDAHPDRVARELGLDGAAVEKLVALNDDLLGQIRRRIEAAHSKEPGGRLI